MKSSPSSRTRNSTLNLLSSFGGQLLALLLRFVTRTVFIQTLGESYLGINGLFADVLSMLNLTDLGFETAITFKMYKPLVDHDDKRIRMLLKFYKQAYRVVGIVILVIGLGLIPFLHVIIHDYDSLEKLGINAALIFFLYLMQSVSSYLFFAYRSSVMFAAQKRYILDTADYVVTIVTNAVQIIILLIWKDFVMYTAVVIAFNIIKNLINAAIAHRYFPQFFIKEESSITKAEIIDLIKDCGALFVYRINTVVLKATDNIVLSTFIGLNIVGRYSNYLLFYTSIRSILDKLYQAVKASMGNLFATESMEKKYKFFQVMNYLSIILYGTAAVGVAVCADELIEVWIKKPEYVIAQPFAILIGIEVLFRGLTNNLGQVRNVSGVFQQMWYRPLLGIIVNIGVSVGLVQVCGIYGVIIGTIAATVLTIFLVDPRVIHKYSFQNFKPASEYYKKNMIYILLLSVIGAVDYIICNYVFTGHGWFSLFFHVLVVAVTVPLTFILLYWKTNECQYLYHLAKGTIHKLLNSKKKTKD